MFCINCGKEIPDESMFCPFCGHNIKATEMIEKEENSIMSEDRVREEKINKALEDVKTKDTGEVPMHIRNAPIEKMKELGYHEGYLYPHDFPGHYVEQQYLPDKMVGTKYYVKDEK